MREMEARQEAGRMGKGRRETKYKRMKEGTVGRKKRLHQKREKEVKKQTKGRRMRRIKNQKT